MTKRDKRGAARIGGLPIKLYGSIYEAAVPLMQSKSAFAMMSRYVEGVWRERGPLMTMSSMHIRNDATCSSSAGHSKRSVSFVL